MYKRASDLRRPSRSDLRKLLYLLRTAAGVGRASRAVAHNADRGVERQTLKIQYTIHSLFPLFDSRNATPPDSSSLDERAPLGAGEEIASALLAMPHAGDAPLLRFLRSGVAAGMSRAGATIGEQGNAAVQLQLLQTENSVHRETLFLTGDSPPCHTRPHRGVDGSGDTPLRDVDQ